jgi:hypothetical protein
VRLGEGRAGALAPDGRWVAVIDPRGLNEITLVPVGEGAPRKVPAPGIRPSWVRYFPDGQRLLLTGNESGKGMGLYIVPLAGGSPIALNTGMRSAIISPDGRYIAGAGVDGKIAIMRDNGGESRVISEETGILPVVWCADGKSILVQHSGRSVPVRISRMEVASGRLTPWREFSPQDPVGFNGVLRLHISANEKSYAYTFLRALSELYIIDGWR